MEYQLSSLFDQLLERQEITVAITDSTHAESLRTGLLRKLRQYKQLWDSVGFLSSEVKAYGISLKMNEDRTAATISLKTYRRRYTYEFLSLVGSDVLSGSGLHGHAEDQGE